MKVRVAAMACVALGCAMFVSTLANVTACAKDPPKPDSAKPIVVGVSLGLTGGLAGTAGPIRDAIRAAEGEINAAGGLLGRQVIFDIVDDTSDEDKGVTVGIAQGFADRNVAAVIGPIGSQQVKITQGIFSEKQIIQISPSATSTELTTIQPAGDRYFFRTTPADDFQGAAVILFAAKTPRGLGDAGVGAIQGGPDGGAAVASTCSKLALVYLDNAYGSSMAKVISDNFPKGAGRSVVSQQKIPLEVMTSYADMVSSIIATGPECLAIISYEDTAAQFIRDFKADSRYPALESAGFFFIGTDGVYTQIFLDKSRTDTASDTSASTAEGVFGTNPDTQPGTVEYNRFKTIYASYFPLAKSTDDAPPFAANAFDAAVLIAFAIQKAGTADDRVAVRDALRAVATSPGRPISPSEITDGLIELRNGGDIDYKGASGNVDFQANGNVTSGFIVWQAARDPISKKLVFKTVARFATDELVSQLQ